MSAAHPRYSWEARTAFDAALEELQCHDEEMWAICEFLAQTGIAYDELVSIGCEGSDVLRARSLHVCGWEGQRIVPLSDPAWMLFVYYLAIPTWAHFEGLEKRWRAALPKDMHGTHFDDAMRDLYLHRIADERKPNDDEVPF